MWVTIGLLAASIGAQYLIPKPKQKVDNTTDAQIPQAEPGQALPEVYGLGRVSGNFFFSTNPTVVRETSTVGKGSGQQVEESFTVVELMAYALSCNEPVDIVELYLNGELVYAPGTTNGNLLLKSNNFLRDHLTIFSGTPDQPVSSELLAATGAAVLPNFQSMSYVLLRDIKLSNYGNQYPAVTAVLRSKTTYSNVKQFLDKIIENSGVNEISQSVAGIDTLVVSNSLTTIPFDGTVIQQESGDYLSHITPLLELWQIARDESVAGVTTLTLPINTVTNDQTVTSIESDDILGTDAGASYEVSDTAIENIPNQLELQYIDVNKNLDRNSVTAIVSKPGTPQSISYSYPFAMNRSNAMSGAQRLLRNSWVRKKSITFTLPMRFESLVRVGSLLRFQNDAIISNQLWIGSTVSYSSQGFFEVVAQAINPVTTAYASNISNTPSTEVETGGGFLADNLLISDIPDVNLITSSNDRTSAYLGVSVPNYNGAIYIYTSPDDVNYELTATTNDRAITGSLVNTLPTSKGFVPDESNKIVISLADDSNSLTSVTEEEFQQGNRLIAIGKEIIAYRDATQIGTSTWELTGLLRGYYDTEEYISEKPVSSPITILRELGGDAPRIPLALSDRGDLYYKATVSTSPDLNSLTTRYRNFEANTAKALAPIVLNPKRLSNGDWVINWVARSVNRANFLIEDGVARSTNPDGNRFDLLIYDSNLTLLTTKTIDGTGYTYTSNEQIQDAGSVVDKLNITVFQQSLESSSGRGYESI